ncbi:MAG: EAL domain-containing protein [Casimicrobiaceae bacterium]
MAIETGRSGARTEINYRIMRGDSAIHLRQTLEIVAGDASSQDGRRWFNTIQDVTEAHRESQKVLEAERKYRSIFENTVLGIFQTRSDGTLISANPAAAELLGYSSPQELVAEVHDLGEQVYVDPADRKAFVEELLAGRTVHAFETRFKRKHGEVIWVSLGARLETDEGSGLRYFLGSIQDITERKAQQEKIARLSRVYAVLSGINTLIVRVDDRRVLFAEACRIAIAEGKFSKAWIATVEPTTRALALMASEGFEAGFVERLLANLNATIGEGRSLTSRAVISRKLAVSNDIRNDADIRERETILTTGSRAMAALPLVIRGEAVGVMLLHVEETNFFDEEEVRLLTELAGDIAFALDHLEKVERADYLALYDQLTGLPNRRLFCDRLDQMVSGVSANKPNVAVACVDIDRLAMINESYGRNGGDTLLSDLAERLVSIFSQIGTVARIGGDQFAVAVPGNWDAVAIARGRETFYPALFALPFVIAGQELQIAGAVGLAFAPADGVNADALIGNAEAALARAKADGERMLLYNAEMNARVTNTLELENRLRKAIERNEFVLHYQPKVELEHRTIVGVEALIRWQSPDLGLVPPLEFISLLEQTGMIIEVGAWALRRAALDHRAWVEAGLAAPRVAVNVSAVQLRQKDFVRHVRQAIDEGVTPPGIDLEITESLVMTDILGNVEKLKEVRDLGTSIAIDDFGTGYSSLAYLAKLPVQALKIDRSFIITMLKDPATMALVQTIISLAHTLRLKVVAEGVDEEEQANMLRLLRCDEMQGYLFSKPLPFAEMTALLKKCQQFKTAPS